MLRAFTLFAPEDSTKAINFFAAKKFFSKRPIHCRIKFFLSRDSFFDDTSSVYIGILPETREKKTKRDRNSSREITG